MPERDALRRHLDGLREQAAFARQTLRTTVDVLDRVLAAEPTSQQIDQARSQARAALRALRSTNQLLAQAAELIDSTATGGSADGTHRARSGTAHVG